jgi:hypothetical protein
MLYELLDLETANAVAGFSTEAEALAEIRALLRQHGPNAAATLALGYEDEQGNGELIAAGNDLARLARAAAPTESPSISA